jgi:hypothetical protein
MRAIVPATDQTILAASLSHLSVISHMHFTATLLLATSPIIPVLVEVFFFESLSCYRENVLVQPLK